MLIIELVTITINILTINTLTINIYTICTYDLLPSLLGSPTAKYPVS